RARLRVRRPSEARRRSLAHGHDDLARRWRRPPAEWWLDPDGRPAGPDANPSGRDRQTRSDPAARGEDAGDDGAASESKAGQADARSPGEAGARRGARTNADAWGADEPRQHGRRDRGAGPGV